MKRGVIWSSIFIVFFTFCEKDDICAEATPNTPLLVLRFYNYNIPDDFKTTTSLKVIGENKTEALVGYDGVNTDSIAIPLKVFDSKTNYTFTISDTDNEGNTIEKSDEINITYQTKEKFLYRGCGFVGNFDSLKLNNIDNSDKWIDSLSVIKTKVEDEFQAHVKIYH